MKKLLFPVIALTLILLMASVVSASADTIWTIGDIEEVPPATADDTKDEFGTDFPSDETTYNVDPNLVIQDPSSFPGILYHLGTSWGGKDTGVHEVTINFSLDRAYSELTLDYYRTGEEDDEVTLDGGAPTLLDGAGEGVWIQHTETWEDVCSGSHSIVITCVDLSGGGIHYVDALVLSGNPVEPEVETSYIGPDSVNVGQLPVPSWTITIEICGDDEEVLDDVVVQGGIGADLAITEVNGNPVDYPMLKKDEQTEGDVTLIKKGGKMGATIVKWDIGTLVSNGCLTLELTVQTGLNPKDKQEFTSEGTHDLDGGFSATFWYCDTEFSTLETDPLTVDVVE